MDRSKLIEVLVVVGEKGGSCVLVDYIIDGEKLEIGKRK
jgi:hypothetical protein